MWNFNSRYESIVWLENRSGQIMLTQIVLAFYSIFGKIARLSFSVYPGFSIRMPTLIWLIGPLLLVPHCEKETCRGDCCTNLLLGSKAQKNEVWEKDLKKTHKNYKVVPKNAKKRIF